MTIGRVTDHVLTVFLVPAGIDRLELYSEAPDDLEGLEPHPEGFIRRWFHKASVRWRELVDAACRGGSSGRFARWRDSLVCHLAESIAEQRTLWALRKTEAAVARFPGNLSPEEARKALDRILADARRHHGRWLIIDVILTSITGPLFFFVPGPNVISWYFLFRVIGHYLSWRGARQAMDRIKWKFVPDQSLAELAKRVNIPRAARAPKVAAIAARLNLPRLSAFFDRVAVPSA
jgi:Mitochondrial K+-H+ exchange-related